MAERHCRTLVELNRRYATALDHEDRDDLGRRPLIGLLPLWLVRALRNRDS